MNGMATPALLPGVDLAAFAAALAARLRDAGIPVSASGQASLVQALQQLVPRTPAALYWGARLTLVSRVDELATFDAVFASLFGVFGSAEPDGANRPLQARAHRWPASGTAPSGDLVPPKPRICPGILAR